MPGRTAYPPSPVARKRKREAGEQSGPASSSKCKKGRKTKPRDRTSRLQPSHELVDLEKQLAHKLLAQVSTVASPRLLVLGGEKGQSKALVFQSPRGAVQEKGRRVPPLFSYAGRGALRMPPEIGNAG